MSEKRIVIGLGTGRCGTDSFARLLNEQKDFKAFHEHFFLQWDERDVVSAVLLFNHLLAQRGSRFVADVAFYWIRHVEKLIPLIPKTKFVCLWRERQEVIDSFDEHSKLRNYWTSPTSKHWDERDENVLDFMMLSFPQYDLPKREAIGAYWDDYDRMSRRLEKHFPGNFMRINMKDALNTEEGMKRVFDFIHLPEDCRVYCTGLQTNKRRTITIDVEPIIEGGSPIKCQGCGKDATKTVHLKAFGMFSFACDDCEENAAKILNKHHKERN